MTVELSPGREIHGLTLLWIDNWWDGPLNGVAEYGSQEHYFDAIWDDQDDDWTVPRRFWLYNLDPHQREQVWQRHRFFEEHVGTVWCYHQGIEPGVRRPAEMHHKFYDRYPPNRSARRTDRAPLGWFVEGELGDFRPKRPTIPT